MKSLSPYCTASSKTINCNDLNFATQLSKYPWQNLDFNDLPGEEWKDIADTDGYFVISNLGRVKSYDRFILTKQRREVFYKGRVYKQQIIYYKNETVGDMIPELVTTICYNGKKLRLRIHRDMYAAFIAAIDFTKDKLLVLHKNGNRLDNRLENLMPGTFNDKASITYAKKRGHKVSAFLTAKSYEIVSAKRKKRISQYTANGKLIKVYNSIKEAAEITSINSSAISSAAKRIRMMKAGGFFWIYGEGPDKINTSFYTDLILNNRKKLCRPVTQFAPDGKIICLYSSIKDASAITGVHRSEIEKAADGKKFTSGGFIWRRGVIERSINIDIMKHKIEKSLIGWRARTSGAC